MIVYEVYAKVREDLCGAFEQYIVDRHIPDLLATGFFKSASFDSSASGSYRMRYYAATREDLDRYFADEAPRLRKDVAHHFPDGIELSRQEWTVLRHFA
jgi:hypothetical protein